MQIATTAMIISAAILSLSVVAYVDAATTTDSDSGTHEPKVAHFIIPILYN
jgi:hypothetical protein